MGEGGDTTRAVELRRFSAEDIGRLLSWVEDESASFLLQWAGPVFTYPLDERQLHEHLAETRGSEPTRLAYLALAADGRTVGYIELSGIDRRNASASVSRVLVAPDERGRGIGAAIVSEVLSIGFCDLGLHRIGLHVFAFNERAIRCYERVGFTREGTLRDARRHDEEYWTLVVMSVLEAEWRARRNAVR